MKIKLTVLLVLTTLLSFADGTVANTLHYTRVEKSVDRKGKSVEKKEEMDFYQNANVLYAEKKNENRSFPSYYFDFNKRVVIVDRYHDERGYVIE